MNETLSRLLRFVSQKSGFEVVLIVLAVVAASVLSTYGLSLLRSWPSEPGCGKEPPIAPYWIPHLQHMVPFLRDPGKTFQINQAKYPNKPFTLLMTGTKFHVFREASTVSHVFSRSRAFTFEPVIASMMENGMDLPVQDRSMFYVQPHQTTGNPVKTQTASSSFVHANHNVWLKYLTGKHLKGIMAVYMHHFRSVLQENADLRGGEPRHLDLHELLQKIIFDTSALTFFGTRLESLWPGNMWEDWKLFNNATYAGVRSNSSFYFRPKAYMARERMLRAFDKWVEVEAAEWPKADGIWNETWGVRMNWERDMLARNFNFSWRGRSCLQAAFLFVIVTNAAPMATWFTYCAANTQERLTKFREELVGARLPSPDDEHVGFDTQALKKNAYIAGLWKEALRLGSTSAAARVVMEDAELEGYVVKKGSVILMPVRLMHFDESVFPKPSEIRPERWIVEDPDDPQQVEQQRRQNNALRSFGGGTGLCSGRFVAEEEILSVVSTLLWNYDVHFDQGLTTYNFDPRSIGVMSPAKNPVVQIHRRAHSD